MCWFVYISTPGEGITFARYGVGRKQVPEPFVRRGVVLLLCLRVKKVEDLYSDHSVILLILLNINLYIEKFKVLPSW